MNDETWTIEWSHSQKCFHVDYLHMTLERNRHCLIDGHESDWILVGIASDIKEANQMAEHMRKIMKKKTS